MGLYEDMQYIKHRDAENILKLCGYTRNADGTYTNKETIPSTIYKINDKGEIVRKDRPLW